MAEDAPSDRARYRPVARGVTDGTVLDIADPGLAVARALLGGDAAVAWVAADVRTWVPVRHYALWHARTAIHLPSGQEETTYRDTRERAVAPGGTVVLATFVPDGPGYCSGPRVTGYHDHALAAVLPTGIDVVGRRREVHVTPSGGEQSITWLGVRRLGS